MEKALLWRIGTIFFAGLFLYEGQKWGKQMKKTVLWRIGTGFFVGLFLFSANMLYRQHLEETQTADAFREIAEMAQTKSDADEEAETPAITTSEKYATLSAQNPDFVGWISIAGTNVDYPVMQSVTRPNYYLNHAFDGSESAYGVPYIQENCDLATADNWILYGHHMKNGTMFADLCKYADADFYAEHKTIRFDTLSAYGTYEILAAFRTVADAEEGFPYYRFVQAASPEDFAAYIAQCKALALYDTGVTAEYGEQLLTLSTCEYSRANGRMVVVAKRSD